MQGAASSIATTRRKKGGAWGCASRSASLRLMSVVFETQHSLSVAVAVAVAVVVAAIVTVTQKTENKIPNQDNTTLLVEPHTALLIELHTPRFCSSVHDRRRRPSAAGLLLGLHVVTLRLCGKAL